MKLLLCMDSYDMTTLRPQTLSVHYLPVTLPAFRSPVTYFQQNRRLEIKEIDLKTIEESPLGHSNRSSWKTQVSVSADKLSARVSKTAAVAKSPKVPPTPCFAPVRSRVQVVNLRQ